MCTFLSNLCSRCSKKPVSPEPEEESQQPKELHKKRSRSFAFEPTDRKRMEDTRSKVLEIGDKIVLKESDVQKSEKVFLLAAELAYPHKEIYFSHLIKQINARIFQAAHLLTFIADKSFTIVAGGENSFEISGYSKLELLGRSLGEIVVTKDLFALADTRINKVVIAIFKTGKDSKELVQMNAHLYCLRYFDYVVTILNIKGATDEVLQQDLLRYEQAVFPIPKEKDVGTTDSAIYYLPEWQHPAKLNFKKLVHALNGPLHKKGSFCLICDNDLQVLAIQKSGLDILNLTPQELFLRKLGENFTEESEKRIIEGLSSSEFERNGLLVCDNVEIEMGNRKIFFARVNISQVFERYLNVIIENIVIPTEAMILSLPGVVSEKERGAGSESQREKDELKLPLDPLTSPSSSLRDSARAPPFGSPISKALAQSTSRSLLPSQSAVSFSVPMGDVSKNVEPRLPLQGEGNMSLL
jgi:hypothetical protein